MQLTSSLIYVHKFERDVVRRPASTHPQPLVWLLVSRFRPSPVKPPPPPDLVVAKDGGALLSFSFRLLLNYFSQPVDLSRWQTERVSASSSSRGFDPEYHISYIVYECSIFFSCHRCRNDPSSMRGVNGNAERTMWTLFSPPSCHWILRRRLPPPSSTTTITI